uniref:receptor protein-tyrosine kinase n=1 Tax=Trichobilharzia regenti TaxID=157069 RepID=A0AA85KDI2_TRIRE|nr:unnamed protein product [Trichobilharzia regenti]
MLLSLVVLISYVLCQYVNILLTVSQEIACNRADVRHPSSLSKFSRCTVIEGDLFIVFTRIPKGANLPLLREITGSLLVYDVEGLDDLSQFLPNLTLIRGQTLVYGYALVIKSTSLKTIGLFSLRVIQHGGVRVDSNPQLCYAKTVDWNAIFESQIGDVSSSLRIVKNGLLCPDTCSSSCFSKMHNDVTHITTEHSNPLLNGGAHCWSVNECQSICPMKCTLRNSTCTMSRPYRCCHPECLAGCYGDGPERCVACKNVMFENRCVSSCPSGTYKYLNRRCITEYQCLVELPNLVYADSPYTYDYYKNNPSVDSFSFSNKTKTESSFALLGDSCLLKCPTGYKKSLKTGRCYACEDQCELKHCREFLIHSLKALDTLVGCHSAKAIYLSIQEGKPETVALLLDKAFANLRVIHHSLRIVRSSVLLHLNFLRHIRSIGHVEKNVSSHTIVFEISGNDNLRELWSLTGNSTKDNKRNHSLHILSHGLIRITQNRELCPEKVFQLFQSGIIKLPGDYNNNTLTQAEREMISITNGDLAYCNWSEFNLKLSNLSSHSVRVTWPYPSTFQFVNKSLYVNNSSIQSDSAKSNPTDELVLIYLFYQLAPNDLPNIKVRKMYDKNSWRMSTVSCDLNIGNTEFDCGSTLNDLEPASRYAVYVEMKFPLRQTGAISNLVYFTTLSINPSPPQYAWLEPNDQSSLRLTWLPPLKPSGTIDSYLIWIHIIQDNPEQYFKRDFCIHKPNWLQSNWHESLPLKQTNQVKFKNHFCDACLSCPNLYEIEQLSNLQTASFSHGKHWPTSVSRWMTDSFGNILPVQVVGEVSSLEYLKFGTIGLIVRKNILPNKYTSNYQETCIPASNENVQLLTGFSPFTKVLIEIQACLDYRSISQIKTVDTNCSLPPPWVNVKPGAYLDLSQLHHQWSAFEVDNIPVPTIHAFSYGPGSIRIIWSNPIKPNGVIIHYMLRYRQKKHDNLHQDNHSSVDISVPWFTKCVSLQDWGTVPSQPTTSLNSNLSFDFHEKLVTRDKRHQQLSNITEGGIVINDLSPGSYEYQIMAISLAGSGEWSPINIFNVPVYSVLHGRILNHQKLLNVFIIITSAFLLVCSVVGVICYKVRRYYLKATAWTSNNPDYCTIYEVDDWEINRNDIDVLDWKYPIGRGSFGTVYKGVVKQLKTPAKIFYNKPVNIPVAIKTISANSTLFDHRDFINEACFMKQFQSYHLVRLLGLVTKTKPNRKSLKLTYRCLHWFRQRHFSEICQFLGRFSRSSSSSSKSPKSKQYPLLSSFISDKQMFDGEECSCHTLASSEKLASIVNASVFNNTQLIGMDNKVAPESPLVIMQLMAKGDLASYLRHLGDKGQGSVNPSQAYLWATQIADGMAYLSAKKYVHRDLAARNCLVDSHLTVKIGDFGLCRDIYEHNYYHKTSRGKLPIRWMAPESLQTAYFTTQSDVWSYGVVLWEIVTMACLPYRGMSHEEVIRYILSGNTLLSNGLPTNCPELFRALMLHCWNFNPSKRPTFLGLCALLSPRFGDAKFRLASFFYHGEQRVIGNQNRSKVLEAPAISLGKLNVSPDQDPAHNLATLLSTFLVNPDDDLGLDDNNLDPCLTDDCSASLIEFKVNSPITSRKSCHTFSGDPEAKRAYAISDKDVPSGLNDSNAALSEVHGLLRFKGLHSSPVTSPFVDSCSFLFTSDEITKSVSDLQNDEFKPVENKPNTENPIT